MSRDKVVSQAEKYAAGGKFDKAIKELLKLTREDPNDMRVRLKIADLTVKKKEIPEALKLYNEIAAHYLKENFHLKAIAVYKTVLKLNPMSTEVNEKLGDLYRKVGLDEDAVNQYYIVAGYYDNKGMMAEAMQIRKKIIEIDPSNVTGRIRLAELLQSTGNTEQCLKEYEQAAEILKRKNDREGLVEIYEKILYCRPDDFSMLIDLIRIYFQKREFKKVLQKMQNATAESKNSPEILELWAEALLEDHQVDQARKKFRDLYARALELHQVERAVKVYSRILQEFGDDQEYMSEINQIQKEWGVTHQEAPPKHREDYEKTEMVDTSNPQDYLKRK